MWRAFATMVKSRKRRPKKRSMRAPAAREAEKMKQMMDELTFGKNLGRMTKPPNS